jgi:IclR family pca regulon transcriptional regulator
MKSLRDIPSDRYVRSLARGLAVIRTFGAERPKQTLSQVASSAGLDRAGARRILLTLKTLGYIRQEGRCFIPTPNILHLGYSYISTIPWWSMAEQKMTELVNTVNRSATLGVLTGSHFISVACVQSRSFLTVNLAVGRRSPVYCTAIGRVLLGGLSDVEVLHILKRRPPVKLTSHTVTSIPALMRIIERDRKQGWSLVSREYDESVSAIAVPVYSQTGQMMAAMSVIEAPISTSDDKLIETVLPVLRQAAAKLWK